VLDGDVPHPPTPAARKRLGAYYTPPEIVEFLVRAVVEPACAGRATPPTVIDPACGDGRLLEAAGRLIRQRFGVDPGPYLRGVEIDADVATATAARLGVVVTVGDGRSPVTGAPFDVVIGNPPYLSQLAVATSRRGRSELGGGPYADVAAEFLAAALRLARADGGRIGLVLPLSILATRDVRPIRDAAQLAGAIDVWWWADERMFDAQVFTGVLGLELGSPPRAVRRFSGPTFVPVSAVAPRTGAPTWSWLVADLAGVPEVDLTSGGGMLGDLATFTADFRDQYYGLVGAVSDGGLGAPLVTSGLIDPGRCWWGTRPTRFAKDRYDAPRVTVSKLSPALQAWVASRLVPKVLVASQTKVLEAVVDEHGAWLPSVPVVSVIPNHGTDVWKVAAVLTSPVASAWLAGRRFGSGLSSTAVPVAAGDLAEIPVPPASGRRAWTAAAAKLQAGDVVGCGMDMLRAYGLRQRSDLLVWWQDRLPR